MYIHVFEARVDPLYGHDSSCSLSLIWMEAFTLIPDSRERLLLIDHKAPPPMTAMGGLIKGNFEAAWSHMVKPGIKGNIESCFRHSVDTIMAKF